VRGKGGKKRKGLLRRGRVKRGTFGLKRGKKGLSREGVGTKKRAEGLGSKKIKNSGRTYSPGKQLTERAKQKGAEKLTGKKQSSMENFIIPSLKAKVQGGGGLGKTTNTEPQAACLRG